MLLRQPGRCTCLSFFVRFLKSGLPRHLASEATELTMTHPRFQHSAICTAIRSYPAIVFQIRIRLPGLHPDQRLGVAAILYRYVHPILHTHCITRPTSRDIAVDEDGEDTWTEDIDITSMPGGSLRINNPP